MPWHGQLGRVLVARLAEGDPDAGAHLDLVILDHEWCAQRRDEAFSGLTGLLRASGLLHQDREFVASKAGRRVAAPKGRGEPPGNRHQQSIARSVPQAVVDQLEVVQVGEQDGQ